MRQPSSGNRADKGNTVMSTRALYSFLDHSGTVNIYKHHDGYPSGAYSAIASALPFTWKLPRFEADEFAAAFCRGTKLETKRGSVRVMPTGEPDKIAKRNCSDIEYRYEISTRNGALHVVARKVHYPWSAESAKDYPAVNRVIFEGSLAEFKAFSKVDA